MPRSPAPEDATTGELAVRLIAEPPGGGIDVDGTGTVPYEYRIVNRKTVPVTAVVEVQSRVYLRDGRIPVSRRAPRDREEARTYDVVDDSVHELTLDGGGVREIAGTVWGVSNSQVYGRVKLRIVSASESAH